MFNKSKLSENTFIIAEVGQNHQGDLDNAREYIRVFAFEGADAIKFQTRNNKYLFSEESFNAKYESENAFAETYGKHREKLELRPEWLPILKEDCEKHGVKFMSTPFDEPSLSLLYKVGVDLIKVASFDIGNIPFIERIAKTKVPVAISAGGAQMDPVRASINVIKKEHENIALLHCVSEYPTEYNRLGLRYIKELEREFPECVIGSSDHFNGILSGPVAYLQGARVFEKHVTLNRAWRGTDHSFALEPEGFKKFVRDIRRVAHMLPPKPVKELGHEQVFKKLGKSLFAVRDIQKGEPITADLLSGKIFKEQIIPVRQSTDVLGKKATKNILQGQPILPEHLEV